jgi:sucrose-6-phosphate hydrolase SacC (GH32 family)
MSWSRREPDLSALEELQFAIPYDDTELVFSGSAVVDKDNTSFGTKANPPLVAIYTSAYKTTDPGAIAFTTTGGPRSLSTPATRCWTSDPVSSGAEGVLVRPRHSGWWS